MYSIYAFNQNFEKKINDDEEAFSDSDHDSEDENERRFRIFTFDWLFKTIMEYCNEDQAEELGLMKGEECIIKVV